jgi:hypothetical protein
VQLLKEVEVVVRDLVCEDTSEDYVLTWRVYGVNGVRMTVSGADGDFRRREWKRHIAARREAPFIAVISCPEVGVLDPPILRTDARPVIVCRSVGNRDCAIRSARAQRTPARAGSFSGP